MKEFIIKQNDASLRLDRFTAKAAPLIPPSLTQKYIRLGRIKVNGRKAQRDTRLVVGDVVQMYVNDEFFDAPTEKNAYLRVTDAKLDVVYEDENILLVNKPSGVLCHSDGGHDYATLIARVQAYLRGKGEWDPRHENAFAPALCNRIDRNTQGIVIAAKNAEALRVINEKIKNREIDKFYLAAVNGVPKPPSGRLEHWLFKDAKKNQVFLSDRQTPGATLAVTEYRTITTRENIALVECKLLTGRTHQIRSQLAKLGTPIIGDGKYGSEKLRREAGEKKQLLCSYKVVFAFTSDAGALDYLSGKTFELKNVDFRDRYFGKNG